MSAATSQKVAEIADRVINEKHLYDYFWMSTTRPYLLIHRDDETSREIYLHDLVHEAVSTMKPHELCDIIWSWDDGTPDEFYDEEDHQNEPKQMLVRLAGWCVHQVVVDLLDPGLVP